MSNVTTPRVRDGASSARRRVGTIATIVCGVAVAGVIASWATGGSAWTSLGLDSPPVSPLTALSSSTMFLTLLAGRSGRRTTTWLAASATAAIAVGHVIDQLGDRGPAVVHDATLPAVVLGASVAIAVALAGLRLRASNVIATGALGAAYFALLGGLLGAPASEGFLVASSPPVIATLAIALASKATFALNGGVAIVRRGERLPITAGVFRLVTLGVQVALPVAVLLIHLGTTAGWWDRAAEANLLGLAAASLLVVVGLRAGVLIDRFARERDDAIAELATTNAQLESRVQARTAEADDLVASMRVVDSELRASEERFRILAESAPVGIYRLDAQHRCIYSNPALHQLLGRTADEIAGPGLLRTLAHEDLERIEAGRADEGELLVQEVSIVRPDGSTRLVRSVATNFFVDGRFAGQVGTTDDITDRVAEAHRLARTLRENEVLVERSATPIFVADETGAVIRANRAATEMFGVEADELLGTHLRDWVAPEAAAQAHRLAAEMVAGRVESTTTETPFVRADGSVVWTETHAIALRDDAGGPSRTFVQVLDIDQRHRHEQHLAALVDTDHLTGMASRYRFERMLDEWIRSGTEGVVLVADLDHFKRINDTLGHHAGDELLRAVGAVLRAEIRDGDVAARLGGDEFGVLLEGAGRDEAARIADRLVDRIRTRTSELFGRRLGVSASIGLTVVDASSTTVSGVLVAVDAAMYDAKDAGRDCWRSSSRDEHGGSTTRTRLADVDRIERALTEEQLELYAQPIRRIDGSIEMFELLLRLRDEDGSSRSPGPLLESAERYGVIGEIDRWVISRSCELSSSVARRGDAGVTLACNISGSSLASTWLVDHVTEQVHLHHVEPGGLVFEITETQAIPDRLEARRNAQALAALGVQLSLDDFGAGHMTFANLRDFPVDYVKIDGSFVIHAAHHDVDRMIVTSVVQLGRLLGARVVAEHVEEIDDVELLRELGVELVQGYALGVPRPLELALAEHVHRGHEPPGDLRASA